jgi:hypothetical protein
MHALLEFLGEIVVDFLACILGSVRGRSALVVVALLTVVIVLAVLLAPG